MSRKLISRAQAQAIADNPNTETMAVPVGDKFLEIPKMPEAYKTPDGRIIRANSRMHINNHISSMGLIPCDLPKPEPKPAPAAMVVAEEGLLSDAMIEALDELKAQDIDIESEKVGDLTKALGMRISKAQVQQYVLRG